VVLVSFREDMPMFSLENTPTETGKYGKGGPSTALIIFLSKAIRGALRWAGENTSARHNTLRHLTSFHASSKTLPRWLGDPA